MKAIIRNMPRTAAKYRPTTVFDYQGEGIKEIFGNSCALSGVIMGDIIEVKQKGKWFVHDERSSLRTWWHKDWLNTNKVAVFVWMLIQKVQFYFK